IRFELETLTQDFFQPVMQVNYPNDHDFTRIVEIKHATGQKLPVTTIVREYPQNFGPGREPYYPIPAPDAKALYSKYAERAASEKNVTFVGRLATYRYYNMNKVIVLALAEFDNSLNLSYRDMPAPQVFGPGREPYYPIPAPDAKALYSKYAERAASEKNVTFVGRFATYRYYNMDQVIGMALAEFDHIFKLS